MTPKTFQGDGIDILQINCPARVRSCKSNPEDRSPPCDRRVFCNQPPTTNDLFFPPSEVWICLPSLTGYDVKGVYPKLLAWSAVAGAKTMLQQYASDGGQSQAKRN